jgi:catechol 2,3-dioxygenase
VTVSGIGNYSMEEMMNTLAHLHAYVLSQVGWSEASGKTRLQRPPKDLRANRSAANPEFAVLGPVHLDVTSRDHSLRFWHDTVGLKLRADDRDAIELGTETNALVVLHPMAKKRVQQGYSGLYHLAIHLPDEPEFVRILARLIEHRARVSAVDHVMSKAIYLNDPDGIGIEFTLETPDRFGGYSVHEDHIALIDIEGGERSGRDSLDIVALLSGLRDRDTARPLLGTIGHVHLHVPDLYKAYAFYRRLGFVENVILPGTGFGDLGTGGAFKHRLGLNTWQGKGAPPAPYGTAGMRHFTLQFDSIDRLDSALKNTPDAEKRGDAYVVRDPAGNRIVLTKQ